MIQSRRRPRIVLLAAAITVLPVAAAAQSTVSDKISVEFVGAVSITSATLDDPFIVLDGTATVRVSRTFDVIVRPYLRRLPGGDCSTEMYQLQVRYQPTTRVPLRIDAGIIASPLGLASLEMRPDRNPVIGSPSYYFSPLPSFNGQFDRVQLLSGGYPLGAMLNASGPRWDVRAGITDGTPTRTRKMFTAERRAATPQFVSGAGFLPITGLRVGIGFARGAYRTDALSTAQPDTSVSQPGRTMATVLNVEADYAVGYTRVTGEWILDHFDTTADPAVARGYLLQAVRTLTPRWFAAGRTTRVTTPVYAAGVRRTRSSPTADLTMGYRVTPDITLRAGYQGSRAYAREAWDHAAAASFVWSKRWW